MVILHKKTRKKLDNSSILTKNLDKNRFVYYNYDITLRFLALVP